MFTHMDGPDDTSSEAATEGSNAEGSDAGDTPQLCATTKQTRAV